MNRSASFKRARRNGPRTTGPLSLEYPLRGWKDIFWRTYEQFNEDRLLAVAGGVVFFVLLALFPGISAFVSLYGLFADRATLADHLGIIATVAPAEAFSIIHDQIERVMNTSNDSLGFTFLVSFGLALWSANAGVKAVMDALNVAYEEKEQRSFIRLNLESLLFTLRLPRWAAASPSPVSYRCRRFRFSRAQLLHRGYYFLLAMAGAAAAAGDLPQHALPFRAVRRHAKWTWLTPGSVVAAILWLAGLVSCRCISRISPITMPSMARSALRLA